LSIPDNSIDAIITDPPYGSNVQYGELSQFWLVWLRDELPIPGLFSLDDEILVQRKNQSTGGKDYKYYAEGMFQVFREGFRVLKPGRPLVFTFNNKDMRAWFAVIKAAIKAGFYLDPKGVIYQEPIENYKNTAHLRYEGSLHGDFIYTFIKPLTNNRQNGLELPNSSQEVLEEEIVRVAEDYLFENGQATTSELYIQILPKLIPVMVRSAANDENFSKFNSLLDNRLETLFERNLFQDASSKEWRLVNPSKTTTNISRRVERQLSMSFGEITQCDYSPSYENSDLIKEINNLEGSFEIYDEEPIFENLVNMSLSGSEPYHRWARYREGYSGRLVKELIHRSGINQKSHFVFDPMCGSGSTLVAAAQLGFDCIGSDVNPYSIDLSSAKIRYYSPSTLEKARAYISEPKVNLQQVSFETWKKVRTVEKYFWKPNLEQLLSILGNIDTLKDPIVSHLLKVAWLAILEDCSERKKDGNGLATRPTPISDVWTRFVNQLQMQLEDIEKYPLPKEVTTEAICETAFESSAIIQSFSERTRKELGCIIFSPPYANSFDYFESYKLELLFGGYFDEQTLVTGRERTIRNYRKGYGYQLNTQNQFVSMLADEVRHRIPEKEKKTGRNDNRSRLVPNLLIGYFEDMEKVISSFYNSMPPDSTCHIVVDQSSYLGVVVPTDILLAEIAQGQGFIVDRLTRCRRANTSGQQLNEYPYLKSILRESIVSLVKT
jgi:DNA modification methylase